MKNQVAIKIVRSLYTVSNTIAEKARFSGIEERWGTEGGRFIKRVYVKRDPGKRIRLTYKLVRAAVELCFSSTQGSHYIYPDEEEFKPMSSVASRKKRCNVCSGSVKRGQEMCDKCQSLPEESQRIVKGVNPMVVITVDEKWRWITGHISLEVS